jgi:NADPH:quinone reductase-like Zn-dependent oxidoreductase
MEAIVFTKYGSPDLLELKDFPTPSPKEDEVLVRIHASSINSWDWEYLNGFPFMNRLMFGLFKPKQGKQRLGADTAGVVEAVGRNVTRFEPGDEVFGDLWDHWGGFAEYACATETALERKPANLSFEQAAAIPQAGVLALQAIRKAKLLQADQKVLINGAGGGVGTFAIQLAKLAGAEVTGVDAAHKLEATRGVGADHVIDYAKTDYTRTGQQYDLIVDCHGVRSMFSYKRALAPGGTFAMVGGTMRRVLQMTLLNLLPSFSHNPKRLRLVADGPNKGLEELKSLAEDGQLVPVIDRTYRLDEVPEALRYFGQQQHTGKIAVSIPHSEPSTGEVCPL